MNSASQNFPHHLGMLRERTLHPTEYELAVNYFLEEFAGDVAFVRVFGTGTPHLVAVLGIVVSRAMGASRGDGEHACIIFARTSLRARQRAGGRAYCVVLLF